MTKFIRIALVCPEPILLIMMERPGLFKGVWEMF